MNALTLHQPWASLVALGVKTIETRSWPAPKSAIGQRLVIHAGAKPPTAGEEVGEWYWEPDDGNPCLISISARREAPAPLGAVVASCTLTDCLPIAEGEHAPCPGEYVAVVGADRLWLVGPENIESYGPGIDRDMRDASPLHDQLPYGDFRPGRWAWLLDDIKPTTERCPAGCHGGIVAQSPGNPADGIAPCDVCNGVGRCDPIPAKGHQRLWKWAS